MARRRKNSSFKPNRAYVSEAVGKFLKKGGKITQVKFDDALYNQFVSRSRSVLLDSSWDI